MDEKIKVFKVRPKDYGQRLLTESQDLVDTLLDNMEPGDVFEVQYHGEMTKEEIDKIPEFEGW